MFSLIVATDVNNGISLNGKIPWNCPEDMVHFKNTTTNHVCIMGRKTWDSLPSKYKPLPNRINVVLTRNQWSNENGFPDFIFSSIDDCVTYFSTNKKMYNGKKLFVIGGSEIYKQFLDNNLIYDIHATRINEDYKCDKFILYPRIKLISGVSLSENSIYSVYNTINLEEMTFLNLMRDIIEKGYGRSDRTGTGTISLFSRELRFNLKNNNIPMMTTRPVSLKIVFEELMWILRGQTNVNILKEKNINIWDPNTTREFLDSVGLNALPEGDIGASYGFQMRHFGYDYIDCNQDYTNKGFDQLENVINLLKHNPYSRRILINLYNPTQLNKMALPPCVYGYQFYVADGFLSCKLIQRSSDIALAGSHNCASGALLVHMLCCITGLKPGELIWSPSDIHIYNNQINSVLEQLKRNPKPFPILKIIKPPKDNNILNFEFDHIQLLNYDPFTRIQFAMNA